MGCIYNSQMKKKKETQYRNISTIRFSDFLMRNRERGREMLLYYAMNSLIQVLRYVLKDKFVKVGSTD